MYPTARVLAFEANPINCRAMSGNESLRSQRIEIFPYAISNSKGTCRFHITDVDYSDPAANKGTSSLLVKDDLRVKATVEVEARRIDEFIVEHCPEVQRIGFWIDVEGAEHGVLTGMEGIRERVLAVHVETAEVPMRQGQKTLAELEPLMAQHGFVLCGSNIRRSVGWGDVVFVRRSAAEALGPRFALCKLKGYLAYWFQVDRFAVFLKTRFPAVYRVFRRAYLRIGT
jgi:FkbM family methyltransferase